ncbi:hypothetical protein ACFQ1L_43100 [Phytohabitans flavus]|uniref:hypothetical protein n=1 Tax=Phytohabitans flavus TaxID=1076124 RepID=UPI0015678698|nr:hypothetical protein [Phytohabitans flavus]
MALGITYASWGLAIVCALLFLIAALWTVSAVRSELDARRLERRARRSPSF